MGANPSDGEMPGVIACGFLDESTRIERRIIRIAGIIDFRKSEGAIVFAPNCLLARLFGSLEKPANCNSRLPPCLSRPPPRPMNNVKILLDEVVPEVYRDLRALASRALQNEPVDHTFQTTELVHEAYLRLAEVKQIEWENANHVKRAAVGVVRRVLIDYARAKRSGKRNSKELKTLPSSDQFSELVASPLSYDLLALDEALLQLQEQDQRKASVVELRFFGGLELESVAQVLGISYATAKRDWAFARAWLLKKLSEDPE